MMSIATNQLINEYYNRYRENELVFTKDIMRILRIDPRQIYVKCSGAQWPCIINSTSFQQAKIIIGTSGGAFQQITKKDAPPVNLRYGFTELDGSPLVFFVTCRVSDVTPYMNSHDLAVVTLSFTQRPPDDLIYKLGTLLAADDNFTHRKEDRIVINEDSKRALGIDKKETIIYIQNIPRRCILWNLSFSGAKVVLMGVPKFLENKDCITRFMFSEPNEIVDVKGSIVQSFPVEGRQDLAAVGIKFDENQVPLSYKIRINDYLSTTRKKMLDVAAANSVKILDPVEAAKNNIRKQQQEQGGAANAAKQAEKPEAGAEHTQTAQNAPQNAQPAAQQAPAQAAESAISSAGTDAAAPAQDASQAVSSESTQQANAARTAQ